MWVSIPNIFQWDRQPYVQIMLSTCKQIPQCDLVRFSTTLQHFFLHVDCSLLVRRIRFLLATEKGSSWDLRLCQSAAEVELLANHWKAGSRKSYRDWYVTCLYNTQPQVDKQLRALISFESPTPARNKNQMTICKCRRGIKWRDITQDELILNEQNMSFWKMNISKNGTVSNF